MRHQALIALTILFAGCNDDRIAKLEKQTTELQQQVAGLQKSGQLDLQAKCAADADKWFEKRWQPDKDTMLLDHTNHYNVARNQCFVTVVYNFNGLVQLQWLGTLQLYDVYSNELYGAVTEDHTFENNKSNVTVAARCSARNAVRLRSIANLLRPI